jgi:hypothetical protein
MTSLIISNRPTSEYESSCRLNADIDAQNVWRRRRRSRRFNVGREVAHINPPLIETHGTY